MNQILINLATNLSALVAKHTVTTIQTKVAAMKNEEDINTVKQTYNDLLNNLLDERSEAITIAQSYKAELEKVEISDEDINHLHKTVERLLEIFKTISTMNDEENQSEIQDQINTFEQVKELIGVDTLKTMQLLGFNYKKAIGEPLTKIVSNFILSKAPSADKMEDFQKFMTPEMVEVLKDDTAYKNLKEIADQNNNKEIENHLNSNDKKC